MDSKSAFSERAKHYCNLIDLFQQTLSVSALSYQHLAEKCIFKLTSHKYIANVYREQWHPLCKNTKENIPSFSTLKAMNMQDYLKFQSKVFHRTCYILCVTFILQTQQMPFQHHYHYNGSLGLQKSSITKSLQEQDFTVLQNTLPSNFMIRGDCRASLVESTVRSAPNYLKVFGVTGIVLPLQ